MATEIFAECGCLVARGSGMETYAMRCGAAEERGTMECFPLFPGVALAYTEFRAASCRMRSQALPNVLEIAYCQAGRFECAYKRDYVTYLGAGDFAVSVLSPEQAPPSFPLGYYDGVTLIVDRAQTGATFAGVVEDVAIDWMALEEKFCCGRCCAVAPASPELRRVFEALWAVREAPQRGYLRLKVLECFYLLTQMLPEVLPAAAYYSTQQIAKVKAVREALVAHPERREPLKVLAAHHGMSLTALKECFKAVYGKPVAAFQREYRMHLAAKWLCETTLSVAEIAGRLGYENPNKFSSAFKAVMGETPSVYRRARR